MAYTDSLSLSNSKQIEKLLCEQVESLRLYRNITQSQLADQAGVSLRTIGRLEKGKGVSLDTFIRVLTALGVENSLLNLLPDTAVRPIERIELSGTERKRARPSNRVGESKTWVWGDVEGGDE